MAILTRGERFKDARTNYNQHGKQTMKAVEQATGVSASLIKDLESDTSNRSVGYDKVAALAKHYGISADWLLGLTEDYSLKPCAVDDLGLAPSVVQILKREWIEEKQDQQEWIEETGNVPANWIGSHTAINRLLNHPLMGIVIAQIALAARRVSDYSAADIPEKFELLEQYRQECGEIAYNYRVAQRLKSELMTTYPSLAPLIHITYGTASLEKDIDDICVGFRDCVKEITGYNELINQHRPKTEGGYGND